VRIRTWLVVGVLAACGSFSEANTPDGADGGTPASDGGSGDGAAVVVSDAGLDVSVGPAGDAACDASRRCIDFETPGQRTPDFGFDDALAEVDGGLVIHDAGFGSSYALSARAVNDDLSRGVINFQQVPAALRVRLKVRADERARVDATSTHFIIVTCDNGDNLTGKLTFDGEITVAISDKGDEVGTYALATWLPLEFIAAFDATSRAVTLKRVDTGEQKTITADLPCIAPLSLRLQSSIAGDPKLGTFTISFDDIGIDWN
jgi:hypothetical protein